MTEQEIIAAVKQALTSMEWHATLRLAADDDFEREPNGKIVRRSQFNIIRAIELLGLQFQFEPMVDNVEVSGFGKPFYLNESDRLTALWLACERRFGFRPTRTFFNVVFFDHAHRVAGTSD
jgi:hypothetical protein